MEELMIQIVDGKADSFELLGHYFVAREAIPFEEYANEFQFYEHDIKVAKYKLLDNDDEITYGVNKADLVTFLIEIHRKKLFQIYADEDTELTEIWEVNRVLREEMEAAAAVFFQ